ncbi:MAG: M20 family metallo-hydrolase [Deltaproteobacteria bacterium]|nr:M20 family metallo-hydrolase [Deltaproteobacteria bacterium]
MPSPLTTAVLQQLEREREAMIALQQRLMPIEAIGPGNGGTGEWEKGMAVRAILAQFADRIEEHHAPDPAVPGGQRPNFAAYVCGDRSDRRVWFLAHLDVVPAGDLQAWTTPPFTATVKEGRIYGRGAEDNHQGLASALFAAAAFKAIDRRPPCDIGLLILSDEETGSEFGLSHVLQQADPFHTDDMIIVPDGGPPSGEMIEVAEKGGLWLQCRITGKEAHASTPHAGRNANRAAARLMVALDHLYDRFATTNPLFAPETGSTFEPTRVTGNGVSINMVPGSAEFSLDCRLLPGLASQEVLREVRAIADRIATDCRVHVAIETVRLNEAAPETPTTAPVVARLSSALRDVYGVTPRVMGHGGGSLAAPLRKSGYPAVVYSRTDETLHTANEYCVIDYMLGDAKVLAHVAANA